MTRSGSTLYDTRGCLALGLAVLQGMSFGKACHMAGTIPSQGNAIRDTSVFPRGTAVIWRDKNDRPLPATVLTTGRQRVRILVDGSKKWITPNRLEVVA